jgi:hypothetical protein
MSRKSTIAFSSLYILSIGDPEIRETFVLYQIGIKETEGGMKGEKDKNRKQKRYAYVYTNIGNM